MKKRVLSALLVLCMACSMVSTVWANQATPETADEPASVLLDDSQSAPVTNAPAQDQDVAEGLTAPEDEESGQQSDVDTPDASQPEQVESTGTPVDGGVEYTAALEQDGQALNVIVTAPEGAFDEGVEPKLSVSAIEDEAQTDGIAAKLDEYGLTYDGFAALDISFKNEAGEEIEPNVPVTVRIELPDSIVDSGIDLSTLAVQHLAEDVDGNVTAVEQVASVADNTITLSEEAKAAMQVQAGQENADNGVAPMMLAPAANNALTPDNADAEAPVVAEFTVDGFSKFTITWTGRSGENIDTTLDVTLVTADGNQFVELDSNRPISANVNEDAAFSISDYAPYVQNYTYERAVLASSIEGVANGQGVTRLRLNYDYDWFFGSYNFRWEYNAGNSWREFNATTQHIYLIYSKDTTSGGGGGDGTVTKPASVTTTKTANIVNTQTNSYDLTLGVSGDQGTGTNEMQVDVLFIIDNSGSMDFDMQVGTDKWGYPDYDTRMNVVQSAMSTLVDTLNAKATASNGAINIQYAAVKFSDADGTRTISNWTSNVTNFKNIIANDNILDADGGTNWQAGIYEGNELLKEHDSGDRANATRIVIFLSDGVPTYDGRGTWDDPENGTGYQPDQENVPWDSKQTWNDIAGFARSAAAEAGNIDCNYFYTIGVGDDFEDQSSHAYTNLTTVKNGVTVREGGSSGIFAANDPESLQNAFTDIVAQSFFFSAQNVQIEDELSDWAEFDPQGNDGTIEFTVRIEKQSEDGTSYTTVAEQTADANTSVTLTTTEEDPITVKITPEVNGKAITVRLTETDDSEYSLEPGYRYSVTTRIKPSSDAVTAGMDSDAAKRTPDTGTGTHASNGEQGFFCNAYSTTEVGEDGKPLTEAKVTFTANGADGAEAFPKPVIQVQEPDNGSLTIDKNVNGVNAEGVTFTFTVIAGEDVTSTLPEEFDENGTATVTVTAGGHAVLNDLPFGTYTVTETGAPDIDATSTDGSYHCSGTTYQVGDGTSSNSPVDVILNTDTENQTVTVTNTYTANFTPDPVDPDPDINKYVDDNEDGTYDLSLDITGTAVKDGDAGLNILYILDETYSMMWNMDGSCPDVDADGNESMDDNDRPYNHSGDNRYAFEDVEGEQEDTYPYTDTSIDYTTGAGGRGMYSYERYRTAVNAINTLNGVLLESGVDAEVAVVDFARTYIGENIETANSQDWTTLTDEFSLNPASYDQFASGTNYQAAFKAALDKLEDLETNHSDRLDKNTVVIFVTDGDPNRFDAEDSNYDGTNYFDPATEQRPANYGQTVGENVVGDDDIVPIGIIYGQQELEGLVEALEELEDPQTGVSSSIYAIGISDDATAQNLTNLFYKKYDVSVDNSDIDGDGEGDGWNDDGVAQRFTYSLQDGTTVPDTITSGVYCSSNAEELYQTFAEIAVELSGASMTNVVITDTLSEYAELEDVTQAPVITITAGAGATPQTITSTDYGTSDNGATYTGTYTFTDTNEPEGSQSIELKYQYIAETKTFTLTFPSTYALTDGWTYTITVQIQPTDKAFTDYNANIGQENNNGYGNVTGDPDTDVPGSPEEDWTSSGKPGFDSNTHADVTYTSDEKEWEKEYPVPVIQVKYVELTVNKTVTGTMGDTSSSNTFAFTLTLDSPLASPLPEDLSGTGVANSNGLYEYTFSLASGANIKINIPVGAEVTVAEADRSDYTERFRAYVTGTSAPEAFTDGYTKTIGEMNVNYTIDFQNNRDAITPTGLESNHTTPYVLMITAAGMAGLALIGGIVARRIRRRRED